MLLDSLLAIAHWWLLILMLTLLITELFRMRAPLQRADLMRLPRIDAMYGLSALLMLAVGFGRAALGIKGWAFYSTNPWFWLKLGLFLLIGLASLPPTIQFIRWRNQNNRDGSLPDAAAIAVTRRWIHAQLGLLMLIPVAAVLMARAVGL